MLVWFGQGGRRAWPGTAGLGKQLPGAGKAEWAQPTAQHRGVLGHRSGFPGDQGSPLNVYVHKRLLSETRHLAKLWGVSFVGSTPREGPAGVCVSPCASEALGDHLSCRAEWPLEMAWDLGWLPSLGCG